MTTVVLPDPPEESDTEERMGCWKMTDGMDGLVQEKKSGSNAQPKSSDRVSCDQGQ
jgi:hypothetical protein